MSLGGGSCILSNARVVTCESGHENPYGLLPGLWAVVITNGRIERLHRMENFHPTEGIRVIDVGGKLVTPGLIDCHTHLVYAGDRAAEWEMRLQGRTYTEIAQAGGGILSTVRATRECSEDTLYRLAHARLQELVREGVSCVEIKSGYGLTREDELKLLRVIRRLRENSRIEISATLLAAHTVPPEFRSDPDAYVKLICDDLIPAVAQNGLAEAVDVFCEPIAFSLEQCERIFESAGKHGLAVKAHAEQLSYTGCARTAAIHKAWSVDHVEHLPVTDLDVIRAAGTVAVLLPGAFYALREKQLPPIAELRKANIPMAIATDCNPGTSPFTSLRMMMHLAAVLFSLSPAEVLLGVTAHAAQALGRGGRLGTVTVDKEATLCVWDVEEPAALVTDLSRNPLVRQFIRGEECHV